MGQEPRLRSAALAFAAIFTVGFGASLFWSRSGEGELFFALAAFMGWSASVTLIEWWTLRQTRWSYLKDAFRLVAALGTGWLLWLAFSLNTPLGAEHAATHRLAGVLLLVLGFVIRFLAQYAASVQKQLASRLLNTPVQLAALGFWICLASAVSLFFFLYSGMDWAVGVGRIVGIITALFLAEMLARSALRLYQPLSLRDASAGLTSSALLDAAFRRGNPFTTLSEGIEQSLGIQLRDIWALQFFRRMLAPLLFSVALIAWLSTCLAVVPTDSKGVRVRLGRFVQPALDPGLHFSAPWPFERIASVATEPIRDISLGFDEDIGGAILWNEKHFEGEKNLLVGSGEQLLTINVPIYYKIADPVAYLSRTADAKQALTSLAYRQLLAATVAHDSFQLMTTERSEISALLRKQLQAEVDRFGLGLQIVWIGLKDIHPPVAVAPAYQEVVSAEEEKEALIYFGKKYRSDLLPRAAEEAYRARSAADAFAIMRTRTAEGEASRFSAIESAHAENPSLFQTRQRLSTFEEVLARPNKIVVDRSIATRQQFYLDLRRISDLDFGSEETIAPVPPPLERATESGRQSLPLPPATAPDAKP